jgi:hypothetical protein
MIVKGKNSLTVGDPGAAAGPPSMGCVSVRLTPEGEAEVRAWMAAQPAPVRYLDAVRHLVAAGIAASRGVR